MGHEVADDAEPGGSAWDRHPEGPIDAGGHPVGKQLGTKAPGVLADTKLTTSHQHKGGKRRPGSRSFNEGTGKVPPMGWNDPGHQYVLVGWRPWAQTGGPVVLG